MKITPADIVYMDSQKIAEIIAAGLAELDVRGDLALVPVAQAQRLGGEE